ncbi:uncharacterized protein LOC111703481, partial [Eurytemora carolleeae]|uniref:uncharacterized protein LOC111703481 n=1 Tax=Eurytemora carolleeae TaxID=1294199 RepID=UPI000C78064B
EIFKIRDLEHNPGLFRDERLENWLQERKKRSSVIGPLLHHEISNHKFQDEDEFTQNYRGRRESVLSEKSRNTINQRPQYSSRLDIPPRCSSRMDMSPRCSSRMETSPRRSSRMETSPRRGSRLDISPRRGSSPSKRRDFFVHKRNRSQSVSPGQQHLRTVITRVPTYYAVSSQDDSKVDYTSLLDSDVKMQRYCEASTTKELKDLARVHRMFRQIQRQLHCPEHQEIFKIRDLEHNPGLFRDERLENWLQERKKRSSVIGPLLHHEISNHKFQDEDEFTQNYRGRRESVLSEKSRNTINQRPQYSSRLDIPPRCSSRMDMSPRCSSRMETSPRRSSRMETSPRRGSRLDISPRRGSSPSKRRDFFVHKRNRSQSVSPGQQHLRIRPLMESWSEGDIDAGDRLEGFGSDSDYNLQYGRRKQSTVSRRSSRSAKSELARIRKKEQELAEGRRRANFIVTSGAFTLILLAAFLGFTLGQYA